MPWFLVSFGNFFQNSWKCVHSCCTCGIISSSQLKADQSLDLSSSSSNALQLFLNNPISWCPMKWKSSWNGKLKEQKKKKRITGGLHRAPLLRPERNFVLVCRKCGRSATCRVSLRLCGVAQPQLGFLRVGGGAGGKSAPQNSARSTPRFVRGWSSPERISLLHAECLSGQVPQQTHTGRR